MASSYPVTPPAPGGIPGGPPPPTRGIPGGGGILNGAGWNAGGCPLCTIVSGRIVPNGMIGGMPFGVAGRNPRVLGGGIEGVFGSNEAP